MPINQQIAQSNYTNPLSIFIEDLIKDLAKEHRLPQNLANYFQGEFKRVILERIGIELLEALSTEDLNQLADIIEKATVLPEQAVLNFLEEAIPNLDDKVAGVIQEVVSELK